MPGLDFLDIRPFTMGREVNRSDQMSTSLSSWEHNKVTAQFLLLFSMTSFILVLHSWAELVVKFLEIAFHDIVSEVL